MSYPKNTTLLYKQELCRWHDFASDHAVLQVPSADGLMEVWR